MHESRTYDGATFTWESRGFWMPKQEIIENVQIGQNITEEECEYLWNMDKYKFPSTSPF